jgi:SPX domain.
MVGYGESLERARRPGWDAAYLDYASLKSLLEEVERLHATVAAAADSSSTAEDDFNANDTSSSSYRGDFLTAASGESEMVALLEPSLSHDKGQSTNSTGGASNAPADQAKTSLSIVLEDTEENLPPSSSLLTSSPRKLMQLKAYEATEVFLSSLRKEVEKVSLFALSRQGELADAVGALRFNPHLLDGSGGIGGDDLSKSSHPLFQKNLTIRHDSKGNFRGCEYGSVEEQEGGSTCSDNLTTDGHSSESDDGQIANELWFLLPSMTPGYGKIGDCSKEQMTTNSSLLFRESLETTAPRPLFTGDAVLRTKNKKNEGDQITTTLFMGVMGSIMIVKNTTIMLKMLEQITAKRTNAWTPSHS